MKGLLIVIGSARHDAAHAALSLAAAIAVLRRRPVSIHLHAEAVRIADPEMDWPEDQHFAGNGLPTVRDLLLSVIELGGTVNACQSGLALTGLSADALAPGVQAGGLIDFLARAEDAEIVLG